MHRINRDWTPLHEKLTGTMIRYGFADARDHRTPDTEA